MKSFDFSKLWSKTRLGNLKILKPEWSLSYFKNKQDRVKAKKQMPDLKKQQIKVPYLHNKPHQDKNIIVLFFLHNKLK